MSKFSGKYPYTVDEKGRINFKKLLKRLSDCDRGNGNYHLLKQRLEQNGEFYPFFYIYTESSWNDFYETKQIDSMPTAKRLKFLSAFCGETLLDKTERLTIPKDFLEHLKAAKDLVLQGDGDKIQVWSKEVYDSYMTSLEDKDEELWDIYG